MIVGSQDVDAAKAYLNLERRTAILEIFELDGSAEVNERFIAIYLQRSKVKTADQLTSTTEKMISLAMTMSKPTTIDLTEQRRRETERTLPLPPSPPKNTDLIT